MRVRAYCASTTGSRSQPDDAMEETRLPDRIRLKASISPGGEHAWRRSDVEDAIQAAREVGLGCLGGQVQFQSRDRICEACWVSYDPQERRPDEPWADFVARSADETIEGFRRVCRETDFRSVAREFEFLRAKIEQEGYEPLDDLWFVLYFQEAD